MWLLDGNVLVALTIDTHEFHQRVESWFDSQSEPFATCAITEGTLLRVHMKVAADSRAAGAWSALMVGKLVSSRHDLLGASFTIHRVRSVKKIGFQNGIRG